MTIRAHWLWLPFLAAVTFASPTAAQAGARGVRDATDLFNPKTNDIADIASQIEELHRRYGVDLLIETFSATPADRAGDLKHLGAKKFFPIWAEERALAAGVDGLYILLCYSPSHVEVYVSETFQDTFDKRNRDKLRRTLEHKLKANWHGALQETVDQVRERLVNKEDAAKRGGWLWIMGVVLGILGLWLVFALVRRFQGIKAAAPPNVVSTGALAGQSIYQAISVHEATPAEASTLEYPEPAPKESPPQETAHG